MEKYKTIINKQFKGNEYLELYVSKDKLASTKTHIEDLNVVRKVNENNGHLIVYPNKLNRIEEVKNVVDSALEMLLKDVVSEETLVEAEDTMNQLANYLDCQLLYLNAIEKLKSGIYYRNALDDLRLALEKLLKEVLNVQTGLEKMDKPLLVYLKSRGAATGVANSIVQSLRFLYHYQNNHVKHDNNINEKDMDYIINQINIIVRHIIKLETNQNIQ